MTVGFVLLRVDCDDGVASHLETLMRGLSALGVKVVLLTGPVQRGSAVVGRYEKLASLAHEWIQLALPLGHRAVAWRAIRQIREAIDQHRIELLHLHGLGTLPLARLAVAFKNVPLVGTAHPSGTSRLGPGKYQKLAIRAFAPLLRQFCWPDRAIAVSSQLQGWFISDLRMAPARVETIFHGIDSQYFRPPSPEERRRARQFFDISDDVFVCAQIGRFEPVKRHDVLVRAARAAMDRGVIFKVLLAGAGENAEIIRTLVKDLRLESRCQLYPQMDSRTAFWASDVLVLPSDRESFGLVTAEAMLCGVVPIRTPTAGASDQIVNGQNGYIFPFGDVAELAHILQNLAERGAARVELSRAALAFAKENFDAPLMAAKTARLYARSLPYRRSAGLKVRESPA